MPSVSCSIVIPTYNGRKLLEKNLPKVLEALKGFNSEKKELIIADDASSDTSVNFLNKFKNDYSTKNLSIKIVVNDNRKNGGFSKNINRGVREATGEIIVLLNSDVRPYKDFLTPLIDHFKGENVFAVGCLDESVEGGTSIQRGRGIGKWQRGFLNHKRGEIDKSNTLWVSGGSGAFRKSIWDKLGGLNELYNPFYWEDIDLSYRAQKAGYKIFFESKSRVIHEHEKGTIKTNNSANEVTVTAYRNQFIFVWINITDRRLIFSHILWLPYHILKALLRRDTLFLEGLWLAFLRFDQVRAYREMMKKMFVKTDNEILAPFEIEFSQ